MMAKIETIKKQEAFLAAYSTCANIRRASVAAQISRMTHYHWMERDEQYAARFAEATEDAIDLLEEEARRRAIEGCIKLKFNKDGDPLIDPRTGQPYQELDYSDTLLIFLLKGARPEKYRENIRQELTGPGGVVPVINLTVASEG